MTVRETSREAYRYVMESGHVSKRRRQIYDILYEFGPITANVAYEQFRIRSGSTMRYDSNTCARLNELRTMGLVREVGITIDPITKRNVILWDVTNNLPAKIPKTENKDKIIDRLRKENQTLRNSLIENGILI